MLLHIGRQKHRVQVLLDTGCSVPLVNMETARKLQLPMLKHSPAIHIENFTGQTMEEAGIFYTKPLLLQHRWHFSRETFEVTPMEPEIDAFLPFWWIMKHPPQGAWETKQVRFNSPGCLENCTQYEQGEFSLTTYVIHAAGILFSLISYLLCCIVQLPTVPVRAALTIH